VIAGPTPLAGLSSLAGLTTTVTDGSLLLAVPIAIAAGLVSFFSPCVLPLVPGYLGYVTGLSGVDLGEQRRGRVLAGASLFVAGFTAVYVLVGVAAGALGGLLQAHQRTLTIVLGLVTVVLGLVYLGWIPALAVEGRWDARPAAGLAGAPLLGAVFALSWTACTGPTLGAILALAGIGANPARGALLAVAYCLGLGIPFLLSAVAYRRALGTFAAVRRHRVAITRAGGGMLVVVGVLLVTGLWADLIVQIQNALGGFETVI
jgi:cytochrome c-type biogenesis protein